MCVCVGGNHQLKKTHGLWKIIFKDDEQALERTIALLLKGWSPDQWQHPCCLGAC